MTETTTSPEGAQSQYELLLILSGSLAEAKRTELLAKIEKELKSLGTIKKSYLWENRPLAYKIKQDTTGTYFICHLAIRPAKTAELKNFLGLEADILRQLMIKVPPNYTLQEYQPEDLEADPLKFQKKAAPKFERKSSRNPARKNISQVKDPTPDTSSKKSQKGTEPAKISVKDQKKIDDLLEKL